MLKLPDTFIPIEQPPVNPTEAEKFSKGGAYFANMNRWLVYQTYNTFRTSMSNFVPSTTSTAALGVGIVDEMINNFKYYYGFNGNDTFGWMTQTSRGGDIPAVWINGQKIRQLCDHIKGNVVEMVKPMGRNLMAESISKHSVLKKKEIFDKIDIASIVNPVLEQIGGVKYHPAGDKNYSDKKEYSKAVNEQREIFERASTTLARSVFYSNDCQSKFVEDDAMNAIIGSLASTYIFEQDGEVIHQSIPCYNRTFDFSSTGQFGEDSMYGGFVVPITYEEMLKECPDMPDEWKQEAFDAFAAPQTEFLKWANFYNEPFQNVKWWYNNQKWLTKSVQFWIEKKDSRYQIKTTAYGSKKSRVIDDHKYYQTPNSDGTASNTIGYDVKGDKETYMVHYSILYGNKYMGKYGYEPFQVRNPFNKKMPIIPIFSFCPSKMAGYVRSIVSRLRQNQNELDRLSYKIQQLTANDLGKVFFIKGDKLTEGFQPKDIIDDLKGFKITVLPPTGDEVSDKLGASDLITAVDMSNNQYINSYIELKREQVAEMEAITSTPPASLGMQVSTIGKGVQENTVAQSSLAMLSFYEGLNEFYRKKLQYSVNKLKLVYAQKPGTYIVPISNSETEVLEIPKEFRLEDVLVYIQTADSISPQNRAAVYSLLFNYSQNAGAEPLASAQALLNGLELMTSSSFNEVKDNLKIHIGELQEENKKSAQQAMIVEQQQTAMNQQSAQIAAQQAQIADLYKVLLTENLRGSYQIKTQEVKNGAKSDTDEVVINEAINKQSQLDPTKPAAPQQ